MTTNEKELVAALEADIQKCEFVAGYFEHSGLEIDAIEGKKISGWDYARGLRQLIAEHRVLIEKVRKV
jgi:hypothetical protein